MSSSVGVYSRISSAFWWIRGNICTDADATKPSFCPCQQDESLLRFKARNNLASKVVLKIRDSNKKLIKRKGFKNRNGMKEICIPKDECVTAVVNVPVGEGGYYQLVYNGQYLLNQSMAWRSPKHFSLGCNPP